MADEEKQDVTPDSSLEGAIASSPEAQKEAQEVVSETPTPQQGETQEPVKKEEGSTPFHEHPDWKAFQERKEREVEWYRQQLERAQQQNSQPSTLQPQPDPYQGMTPEERVFWEKQRQIAREEAIKVVQPQAQQAIQEISRLRVEQFRRDHSDIRPDSPEEMQIAEKIRSGYLPEDAYRAVMWDKKVGEKRNVNEEQQRQRLAAKQKANVVSQSSVSSAASPSKKETFMEEVERRLRTENITFD